MDKSFRKIGNLNLACINRGRGEPVLFIHGIPTSGYLWHKVIAELEIEYHCIAPDLMGLGDTEVSLTEDYTMPAQAKMLVEFLDALKISQAHIVAHDQGGAVAQIMAV